MKNIFYQLSLRNKITSIILFAVISMLSIGFGISLYKELEITKQNFINEKILTAKIVASYTISDLAFNNSDAALESLSYLKTDKSIINAHIHRKDHSHFVSLYPLIEHDHDYDYDGNLNTIISNDELLVIEAIYLGGEQIGTLHLLSSLVEHNELLLSRVKYLILLLLALVIASFYLAGKLSRVVTKPILSLVKEIETFSYKTPSFVNVKTKHNDETALLINAFNNMLLQIQNKENQRDAAEQSLLNEKISISDILNNLAEGVVTISESGIIESVNNTAKTMFGYTDSELIGNPISLLTTEQEIEKHQAHINYYHETGTLGIFANGFEITGIKKSNKTFPVKVFISKIHNSDKNKNRFIISCEDISIQKIQSEQLRRTQRMDSLGKLTGGIAHDFNNMLGVIIGYAELIELAPNDVESIKEYISQILHAGERGKNLTAKLLSFTKKESSEEDVTNINSIIENSKNLISKTITSRIILETNLIDNIWQTWLDKGDLEDALINISINAMHAMEQGGLFKIETSNISLNEIEANILNLPAGDYVTLKCSDTGTGMEENVRLHIFDPFFTTKKEKGTGLGLSQVYGFVKRSKGELMVYSEVGKGTTFNFYFPRYFSTTEVANLKNPQYLNDDDYHGSETILVVDDEPGLRLLAKNLLQLYGYNVLTTESAENALNILEQTKVDLLLSDIIMPGLDGYQLAAIVIKKFPDVKIQLASGFSDDLHLNNPNEANILNKNLLHKPYSKDQLLKSIRTLLDN